MTIYQLLVLFPLWVCLPHFCSPEIMFRRTPTPQKRILGARVPRSDGKILHRQKRGWMWNQFFLLEEYTGSDYQYVGKLHSDQDKGDGSLKYILSGDGAGTLFIIDEKTGDIHATRRIDREEKAFYTLRAQAINRRTLRPVEPESEFVIKIHDINDNEPTFPEEIYTASVPEMSVVGTSVVQVTATDADDPSYGNSARVIYSILQGQPYFSVEPETGIIRTALPNMNRENREQYQVVIQAKDMGGQMGGLSGTTTVNITLTDVNDNPPRFPQNTIHLRVLESSPIGTAIGSVKATDADTGKNAEVEYRIIDGDGTDMFDIITEKDTQEGIITVKKPLDYESRRLYTLKVEAENTHVDPRFYYLGPFKDTTIVKISVEDVDEPPIFSRSSYLFEVHEDIEVGTIIGTVMARDPDSTSSPIRFSLDRHTDLDRIFNIHSGNGSLYTSKPLDRELSQWHNLTVIAAEINNPKEMTRVAVFVRILDVNDNAPQFAVFYDTFVCENARPGQLIQTISAVDKDDPLGGQKFFFSLAAVNPNFTVQDNEDNTARILTRKNGFNRHEISTYLLPVVISDNDYPIQSSTGTLSIRVCTCDSQGNMQSCSAEALLLPAGLSTGALIAILLCIIILLVIVVLFAALKRQRKKEPLILSKEDIRDNIVSYNDEGGGEEDTQAFDIGTLRNPAAIEEKKLRRDIIPETLFIPRRTPTAPDNTDVRDFINERLKEHDLDPTAPPYDSLATYAYEGNDSIAESLSSLESGTTDGDQNYDYLREWGPRFNKLAEMYGGGESDKDS
ncbi:cadherin-10 isoform X1 [Halichoerus grypus]|uniref:cadherin-10 isoform X1 n=1 Tax=Phoca vitulina TaxID=9720 RepID=UPI001395E3D2|nr:cadherin-10 isoform X1 [Phoca vitulina]XP_032271335.1 cadherin-10 isoform X1 [Phoca vitulina]XP_032271336.1 cadherin-10 isoform X1 [Phoca vitulina]XP_032271337.1 cadherin-10 isoform X1 [Phoca vitulina]XP_032271338.1 cadherin-10 isoform X1 [Phoca vitulina]XP_032271339.1 cadherin-10 isoform X1 [Phoca vitulina]XP_032271341.1 cadherin-10 isoform X1 [Phoca vitulina]XP_035962653.1 cadherin-10 isoform X1 [Halichoerus grypus]XP_035962655.1 cadherin-10 isoform X1 [Halichoerus grypus]XP_035962656